MNNRSQKCCKFGVFVGLGKLSHRGVKQIPQGHMKQADMELGLSYFGVYVLPIQFLGVWGGVNNYYVKKCSMINSV